MILTTHAIVGAAVGRLFPFNPIIAFLAGFVSHFVIDAIPHWHYKVESIESEPKSSERAFLINKRLVFDFFVIGLDLLIGLYLAMEIFDRGDYSNYSVFAGALGGIFPDGLVFLSLIWRTKILLLFRKFHRFVHARWNINKSFVLGPLSQLVFIVIAVLISKMILG